ISHSSCSCPGTHASIRSSRCPTESRSIMTKLPALLLSALTLPALLGAAASACAAELPAAPVTAPVDWNSWTAGNNVSDIASLQRGARNFMSYCEGCHSLHYE